MRKVDDIGVVLRGQKVDIPIVIDNHQPFGLGAVVDERDGNIVELPLPVEGGDALVLRVVGHQLALHQCIHFVPSRNVPGADGVGGINLP